MIDFLIANYITLAAVYGIIYTTYVVYALFSIRFAEKRRVTERDLAEVCGEALIGPILLPWRILGNVFSAIKVFLLGMVNAGLPKDEGKK